jgi:DNA modification methylase
VSTTAKLALFEDDTQAWGLIEADALMTLAAMPDGCVDTLLVDPPYGIGIVGEAWDGTDIRRAVSAGGKRLSDGVAFERWTKVWTVEALRVLKPGGHAVFFGAPRVFHRLTTAVEDAGWEIRDVLMWLHAQGLPKSRRLPGGLATTLKPAYEPCLLARKSLQGTTMRNVQAWGTGALNIDAARITGSGEPAGFWPANVALSHTGTCSGGSCTIGCPVPFLDGDAPLSRLFYCAKASRAEREAGCEQLPKRSIQLYTGKRHSPRLVRNIHPTVKPINLMRWLVRLVTPPGGLVLDPFTGSGSTGVAAVLEGRTFLGIEREGAYVDVACARLTHWAHEAEKERT